MSFKRVGEIMIPLDEYPHLPHWFTLRQALAEMEGAQYDVGAGGQVASPRSALVFDEAYRLLGQLRRRDIFRGLGPRFLGDKKLHLKGLDVQVDVDPNLLELSFDNMIQQIVEKSELKVSEVMQPIDTTLDFDDTIIKAMNEFVEHEISLLPVLREGKVAGVVNTVCVAHELAKLIL
jgi:CBS domain-containing protein